ncbi:TetR/AcrR family transcriptional regulator, partial [bacterium]|nr:TetR/AcrR family transcriptional regulator [bacterium]
MEKEQIIIKKAKELFSEVGYKSTTMELLADRCNMGKGTLYLYFKSKEDVLKSIIEQLIGTIEEKVRNIEKLNISFSEQISMLLTEMIKIKKEQSLVVKLAFEAKQIGNKVVN